MTAPRSSQHDRLVSSLRCLVVIGIGATLLIGCGRSSGLTRVVVRGDVTLNGSPVEEGHIHFMPIDGTAGPVTIARITGGKYVCDAKGGVPVGKQRVEILAWDPKLPPGGRGEPTRPQLIPEKYNEQSELVETISNESGAVEKNFNL
ncbi:MAG: hypothetical protein WD468_02080 [Pirellulales bacterium]